MTKKHFIQLADAIRDHNKMAASIGQKPFDSNQIEVLASFCMSQNQAFNRVRWLDYISGKCGKNGGKLKSS